MDKLSEKLTNDLNYLLNRAHLKYGPMTSEMETLGVVTEEYLEVVEAMRGKESWKVRAELLDLANGCIRRVLAIDAAAGKDALREGNLATDDTDSTEEEGGCALIVEPMDRTKGIYLEILALDSRFADLPYIEDVCIMVADETTGSHKAVVESMVRVAMQQYLERAGIAARQVARAAENLKVIAEGRAHG